MVWLSIFLIGYLICFVWAMKSEARPIRVRDVVAKLLIALFWIFFLFAVVHFYLEKKFPKLFAKTSEKLERIMDYKIIK